MGRVWWWVLKVFVNWEKSVKICWMQVDDHDEGEFIWEIEGLIERVKVWGSRDSWWGDMKKCWLQFEMRVLWSGLWWRRYIWKFNVYLEFEYISSTWKQARNSSLLSSKSFLDLWSKLEIYSQFAHCFISPLWRSMSYSHLHYWFGNQLNPEIVIPSSITKFNSNAKNFLKRNPITSVLFIMPSSPPPQAWKLNNIPIESNKSLNSIPKPCCFSFLHLYETQNLSHQNILGLIRIEWISCVRVKRQIKFNLVQCPHSWTIRSASNVDLFTNFILDVF